MSEKKYERLSGIEEKSVARAMFLLLSDCPYLPDGVPLKFQQGAKEDCIVFFTTQGSKYVQWFIDGGFKAQLNFGVMYKSFPTSNGQRLNSQEVVDDIMGWLEQTDDLPLLTDGRKITKITVSTSAPYVDETGSDNSIGFAANAVMEYKKKVNYRT